MSIPISQIVKSSISTAGILFKQKGFGVLAIFTDESSNKDIGERIRYYLNMQEVLDDYSATSKTAIAASFYFSQSPAPSKLAIAKRSGSGEKTKLAGVELTSNDISTLATITDASFRYDSGTQLINATNINISSYISSNLLTVNIESIAKALNTSASLSTYEFKEYSDNQFAFVAKSAGASTSIDYLSSANPAAGTDVSALLGLERAQAGKIFEGVDAETIAESLANISNEDDGWYGFAFTNEVRDNVQIQGVDAVLSAALFAESNNKIFATTTNDKTATETTKTDIGAKLKAKNYSKTIVVFSSKYSEYPEIAAVGLAFSADLNARNSTLSLNLSQPSLITSENLSSNKKNILDGKNINAQINVGNISVFARGVMSDSENFGKVQGIDWLNNLIETSIFNFLVSQKKVAYTSSGISSLEQVLIIALKKAIFNGLIAPGYDSENIFIPLGYQTFVQPISEVTLSEKNAGQYNGLSYKAIGSGSISGVEIQGYFT